MKKGQTLSQSLLQHTQLCSVENTRSSVWSLMCVRQLTCWDMSKEAMVSKNSRAGPESSISACTLKSPKTKSLGDPNSAMEMKSASSSKEMAGSQESSNPARSLYHPWPQSTCGGPLDPVSPDRVPSNLKGVFVDNGYSPTLPLQSTL